MLCIFYFLFADTRSSNSKEAQKSVVLTNVVPGSETKTDPDDDCRDKTKAEAFRLRAMSFSDSGFESRGSERLKVRKSSELPSVSKLNIQEARKEHFRQLAEERKNQWINMSKKYEIPEFKFRNFSNIGGKHNKKKVVKQEKVTMQSIMRRSCWNEEEKMENETKK